MLGVTIIVIYLTYLVALIFIYAHITESPNAGNEFNQILSNIQKTTLVNNVNLLNNYIKAVLLHNHSKTVLNSITFAENHITLANFWSNSLIYENYIHNFLISLLHMQPIHQSAGLDYLSAIFAKLKILNDPSADLPLTSHFIQWQAILRNDLTSLHPPTTNFFTNKLFLSLITTPLIIMILFVNIPPSLT